MRAIVRKSILCLFSLFFLFGNINAQRNATEKEIQDRAKQKVGLLCEYISTIADKEQGTLQERLSFSQKALSLFIGKGNSYDENGVTRSGVVMEVSSVNKSTVNRRLMRNYLNGLANMRYEKVIIQHTDIADIKVSNLREDPSEPNRYTCTCDIEQYFEGYNGDGQLLYYDKTVKRVKCYVIREEVDDIENGGKLFEYLVLLGDVQSLETTRERKQ